MNLVEPKNLVLFMKFSIFNIYASTYSSLKRANTWEILNDLEVTRDLLLGGDFNMSLTKEDRFPHNMHIFCGKEKDEWNNMMIKHSLIDISRSSGYTWSSMVKDGDRRDARIDRVHLY